MTMVPVKFRGISRDMMILVFSAYIYWYDGSPPGSLTLGDFGTWDPTRATRNQNAPGEMGRPRGTGGPSA